MKLNLLISRGLFWTGVLAAIPGCPDDSTFDFGATMESVTVADVKGVQITGLEAGALWSGAANAPAVNDIITSIGAAPRDKTVADIKDFRDKLADVAETTLVLKGFRRNGAIWEDLSLELTRTAEAPVPTLLHFAVATDSEARGVLVKPMNGITLPALLETDDIITKLGSTDVRSTAQFQKAEAKITSADTSATVTLLAPPAQTQPAETAETAQVPIPAGTDFRVPVLGMTGQPLTASVAALQSYARASGVRLLKVTTNTPAALASLSAGDVIIEVAGIPVTSRGELQSVLSAHLNEEVFIVYFRGGFRKSTFALLVPSGQSGTLLDTGMVVVDSGGNLIVDSVIEDGPAAKATPPLAEGDVIVSIANVEVHTRDDFNRVLSEQSHEDPLAIGFTRDGVRLQTALQLEAPETTSTRSPLTDALIQLLSGIVRSGTNDTSGE